MPDKLLIIIPCYNEEAALPALLNTLSGISLNQNYRVEIAVINDCSTDNTLSVARRHNVTVIDLPINLGIGGAVQSGLIYARQNNFDLAVQMDGDGQHPPHELAKLLACDEASGANLIIGSRFIEREGFQSSFTRRLGIGYFHWLNKVFTGQSIFDSTSGFRLFDRKAITLAAAHYPDEYPEPESLILFSRAGLTNFASLYYCIKVTIAMVFASIRKI
jgi:glycosyltransferase involved in cell wall biosynthesis